VQIPRRYINRRTLSISYGSRDGSTGVRTLKLLRNIISTSFTSSSYHHLELSLSLSQRRVPSCLESHQALDIRRSCRILSSRVNQRTLSTTKASRNISFRKQRTTYFLWISPISPISQPFSSTKTTDFIVECACYTII